ncbi:MAG: DUF167 domain-containing protein [bacterium]
MNSIINVKVIPNAKKDRVLGHGEGLKVYLNAPPVDGKANKRLVEVLSLHFGVKKSSVSILRGAKGRNKTVKIAS